MPATLHDIAQKAGLSVSTVSRVLNGKAEAYRISEETRRLVLKTAEELSYRPNPLARGLRMKKTNTIGLVVPDISNPFFAHITRSVQSGVHRLGFSLVVCDTDEDQEMEIEHVELLQSKSVDGLIVIPIGERTEHLEAVVQRGTPLVLLDRYLEEVDAESVVVDNFSGGLIGTEYLISCGHRRIGIIQGMPHTWTSMSRVRGYLEALARAGIAVEEELIVGRDFREQSGYEAALQLLDLAQPPSAIFACSDLIGLGVLKAAAERGVRIPDDLSLVVFDDVDFAPYLASPLTAVAQPREELGEMSVKLLVEQIEQEDEKAVPHRRIVLPPQLIVRKSVRRLSPLPESAELVGAAPSV